MAKCKLVKVGDMTPDEKKKCGCEGMGEGELIAVTIPDEPSQVDETEQAS